MADKTRRRDESNLTFSHLFLVFIVISFTLPQLISSKCVLFNFGDSNSDAGGLSAGLGFYLGPPSGRSFFHRTTGRFSDGRLYIDFICEGLKINYMSHYLESSGSNFTHGVNFAVAGAATVDAGTPFSLPVQVLQFLHFKNKTRELRPQGLGSLITEEEFGNAIYSFDIGQNDISFELTDNATYTRVLEGIPAIISRIKDAILSIMKNGGKKFWIYNTGPLGCLPKMLAIWQTQHSKLDSIGCLEDYNNVAMAFNAHISQLCNDLSDEYKNATFVCVDIYTIKYDLFANHTKYGFEQPLMACCGHGGPPYNFKAMMTCGQPTATACPLGERFISWDGLHYTEAANEIIAAKILSNEYSKPPISLVELCQ
ncbi:hypothetical protein LUZ60_003502 [Juncus effusus]|nr:hypothetical protein LUZ60_003502 [Juncus effusus]